MKITEGTRVMIRPFAQELYRVGQSGEVIMMERTVGVGTSYVVRDMHGVKVVLSRDEIIPISPSAPRVTSATVYGSSETSDVRKVRASVERTPSRPRARNLRSFPIGERPMPLF